MKARKMTQWVKGHTMQVWVPEPDSPAPIQMTEWTCMGDPSTPTRVTPVLPQGDGKQTQESTLNLLRLEALHK